MKLDLESNQSTLASTGNDFSNNDKTIEKSDADVSKMLRDGIEAAQNGRAAEARSLLLRVAELDENNEKAWLWLASISEYPEELLVFLNNVLKINPKNARALEWSKATKNLLSKTLVQRGIEASSEQTELAKQCFSQATDYDEKNEMAWLWLASVSDSEEEKSQYLQKVLSINPENESAKSILQSISQNRLEILFQEAENFAVEGNNKQALESLETYLNESPECEKALILKAFLVEPIEEKFAIFNQVSKLNPKNDTARANAEFLRQMFEKQTVEAKFDEKDKTSEILEPKEKVDSDSSDFNQNEAREKHDDDEISVTAEESSSQESQPQFEENLNDEIQFSEVETSEEETQFAESASSETESQENDRPEVYETQDQSSEPHVDVVVAPQPSFEFVENEDVLEVNTSSEVYEMEELQGVAENNYSHIFEADENLPVSPDTTNGLPQEDFTKDEEKPVVASENDHENTEAQLSSDTVTCPFCDAKNEPQSFVCRVCRGVIVLSDLEMVLANQEADKELIGNAVCLMEAEKKRGELNREEIKMLALGYLNLGNATKAVETLKQAAKINPNDVVLNSQINALKIRLADLEKQKQHSKSMTKNLTIFVVDDSATVRKLISNKLEKCGHEVVCATDGIEALEKMKELVPDLILLDINMPQMDGYQVCKIIRGNEATKDVPIVMISGKDGFFDKVRGRMAGTTGYITKPFGPETLMKTVETYTK